MRKLKLGIITALTYSSIDTGHFFKLDMNALFVIFYKL